MFSFFKKFLGNEYITQSLYKQNVEITAKNKTLSLLSKLYEVSVLSLESKELALRVCDSVRTDWSLELTGIFLYNQNKDGGLFPLAFSSSDRMLSVQERFNINFNSIAFQTGSITGFVKKIIDNKTVGYSEELKDVWSSKIPNEMYDEIKTEGRVRTSLFYPLKTSDKVIGLLVLSFNKPYNSLAQYEKETIHSFTNVIAVALDKALLYEQLKIANERLLQLNKQKSEFISFATHQLRSPLTAMKGYASLILEGDYGKVDDQLRGAVSRILDSSNTLVSVVDDYLNISRIELGTMKYNFMPLDFRSIINNVMAEMMPTIEKTGLSFSFIADKTQKYPIDADPDKFRQVISNLVDNSLKYTKEGSIAITLTKNNGKILFTIKDTGIGMSKEILPKLFQKFTRAHNANEANIRGTGLGLYVAKEIVTAHKGKLWAESEGDGKGSQFYVEMEEKK